MYRCLKPKKLVASILITFTLIISLYPVLPAHAANAALTLSPTSGVVGQSVAANGTIPTSGGGFRLFFDAINVRNGTAIGTVFAVSFNVPQATNGVHTVTLQDITANSNATQNFTVNISYGVTPILPTAPKQAQEGDSVQIKASILGGAPSTSYQRTVNVTIPTGAVFTNLTSFFTNQTGTAETVLQFPTDFAPAGLHTNYTGAYTVRIYRNSTAIGGQSAFFVGLTNATSYHRLDYVNIKAMGYTKTNEHANVTIAFSGKKVNQTSVAAVNGEVLYNWQVRANASIGIYTVTVSSLNASGTVKTPPDKQNFTVPGFTVKFFTVNLDLEKAPGVNATLYQIDPFNSSRKTMAATGLTDGNGTKVYTLERGDYTVNAFLKNVLVNRTDLIRIENTSSWTIISNLTQISLIAFDGKTGLPLPFVFFVLNSSYRTVSNSLQTETQAASSNTSSTWTLKNQLIAANYTVSAFRAPRPFNTTSFRILPGTKAYSLNVTCPAYSLTIHAEDARQASVGSGYPIKIYEYGGGLYDSLTTNSDGNVTFTAASGQYSIRLYNPAQTVVLNDTFFVLMNTTSLTIRSSVFNANLSVQVVGYLGQPIPNVLVRIQPQYSSPTEADTNGNGVAFFDSIVGGPTHVAVFVGGDTPSAQTDVNVSGNTAITLSLGNYISVFGLLVDTGQFAVLLTVILFIIVFALFMIYRQMKKPKSSPEPTKKT